MFIKVLIMMFVNLMRRDIVGAINQETFRRLLGNNEVTGSNMITDINGTGSVFECIGNCKSDRQCWSLGYKHDGAVCRLISTLLDESDVEGTDYGWTYFVMTGTCATYNDGHQSCYYFKDNVRRTFNESQAICNSRGSYLVNIDSSEENDFILDIVRKRDIKAWIGCSDELNEGTWTCFPSMTNLTYTNWRPGQPGGGDHENCLAFYKGNDYTSYQWHDLNCDYTSIVICEI